jgi:hypothetical protein|tara:strand:+ start:15 stop:209 length:195 start_codon:yes stop_codon:yes gene_type:complete
MSITLKKNKRIKFGLFKSESAAQAECEKRKGPHLAEATFFTQKVQRMKSGQRSWLAYCLIPKGR